MIFLMSHSFRSRIPELRTQEVQYVWIEHKMVPKKVKCTMGSKGRTQISTGHDTNQHICQRDFGLKRSI